MLVSLEIQHITGDNGKKHAVKIEPEAPKHGSGDYAQRRQLIEEIIEKFALPCHYLLFSTGARPAGSEHRRTGSVLSIAMLNRIAAIHRHFSYRLTGLVPALAVGMLLGCATAAPPVQTNHQLLESVHGAVPSDWHEAASRTPDINPLEVSENLRQFVQSRTADKMRPRDRMLALAAAVFDPDGVGLTYSESATHTAAETYAIGLGNCMSFSNLLVAAAREAGLKANYELMSNYSNWQQQGDFLVRTMHVRVVSRIRNQKLVFDFYPDPVNPGSWSRQLDDRQARAHHLNNLAAEFMRQGDLASAYGHLYTALQTSLDLSFLWSNLGALLSRRDLTSHAESAYREAMRLDPEQLTAVSNLQRLYQRTGRDQDAAALEAQVVRYRERNPFYHFWQAEQAYEDENFATAEEHYRAAIRLKSDERQFYVGLARAYYKQGKVLAARKAINKSHKLFAPQVDTVTVRPRRN